jgi:hypothetical protein
MIRDAENVKMDDGVSGRRALLFVGDILADIHKHHYSGPSSYSGAIRR